VCRIAQPVMLANDLLGMPGMKQRHNIAKWVILSGILLIALVECAWRAWGRTGQRLYDFELLRASALLWMHGANPFALPPASLLSQAIAVERTPITIYPTTLLLLSPFAMVPLALAMNLWFVFSIGMVLLLIVSLVKLARWPWISPATIIFSAFVLAFGPIQSGLVAGQPLIPAASLVMLALWAVSRHQNILAGLLLGLAIAWKPQVGGPFLLYLLYKRQWMTGTSSLLLLAILSVAAIAPIQQRHPEWPQTLQSNVQFVFAPGHLNDFETSNLTRDHMLNLQLPVYAICPSRAVANVVAIGITLVLLVIFLFVARKSDERMMLLEYSIVACLCLLPAYHRYYDATLLTLAICWAIDAIKNRSSKIAWIVLAPMTTFFAPVGLALTMVRNGRIPMDVQSSWWWNTIIIPAHSWILLLICILLIAERIRIARPQSSGAPHGD